MKKLIIATTLFLMAHSWYPPECCHDIDCAEVIVITSVTMPDSNKPIFILTTKHGTGIVPDNLPRRESKDTKMHACMLPGSDGKMKVICLFIPPIM